MNSKYMILPVMLLLGACSADNTDYRTPEPDAVPVYLPVAPLGDTNHTQSRAAVDEWDQTTIALAYREFPQTIYTNNVNVVVKQRTNLAEYSPQTIHTGMQYARDNSEMYIRGYHPVVSPDASGIAHYDMSRGDIDLMCSNEVHGNESDPIIDHAENVLLFKHKLTRITVRMTCAPGHAYPERIAALIVGGNVGQYYLPTQAELNLATGNVKFRGLGIVRAGYKSNGFMIPPYGGAPAELEAMVVPETPLKIRLLSTGETMTDINLAGSALDFLETAGGAVGKHYIINLSVYSTSILVKDIEIVEWTVVSPPTQTWW